VRLFVVFYDYEKAVHLTLFLIVNWIAEIYVTLSQRLLQLSCNCFIFEEYCYWQFWRNDAVQYEPAVVHFNIFYMLAFRSVFCLCSTSVHCNGVRFAGLYVEAQTIWHWKPLEMLLTDWMNAAYCVFASNCTSSSGGSYLRRTNFVEWLLFYVHLLILCWWRC